MWTITYTIRRVRSHIALCFPLWLIKMRGWYALLYLMITFQRRFLASNWTSGQQRLTPHYIYAAAVRLYAQRRWTKYCSSQLCLSVSHQMPIRLLLNVTFPKSSVLLKILMKSVISAAYSQEKQLTEKDHCFDSKYEMILRLNVGLWELYLCKQHNLYLVLKTTAKVYFNQDFEFL